MKRKVLVSTFAVLSLLLVSVAGAQSNPSPTVFLSAGEVSFFNGDQDTIDATITNNDLEQHTFTISVFPTSFDNVFGDVTPAHVTLLPRQSAVFKVSFSSLFEAEFVPRQFTVTAAATDDASVSTSKTVYVNILRRSPVFVLSLLTNRFSYQPGETVNITSVVANQGGDSFEEYKMQTIIAKDGEFLKRFETPITYLPQKSQNTFSNLYTVEQFSEPGTYSAQLVLKDAGGQTLSIKSVNFRVGEVSRASQQETSSVGVLESSTTITSKNEGNSPSDIEVTAVIPSMARDIFVFDITPTMLEAQGSSIRVSWIFENVAPGEIVSVAYKFSLWKIWGSILLIIFAVYLAFKFVFTVKIIKRSGFAGPIVKDSEIPVSIEIINRSIHEVKDLVVKDFIPPIARVVPKFETVKPAMHETSGGTEVSWKFDSLRAGEERVMTYKIKPKMDVVGSLRLNPATLNYSNRKRQKKSSVSGLIVIRTLQ